MTNQPLILWYKHPAQKWVEALPIGNGRLGAMIFGGVPQERLQLNEDTLDGKLRRKPESRRKPRASITPAC